MPELKVNDDVMEIFGKAGCSERQIQQLLYIVQNNWQVTKEMYPKLVRVLGGFQKNDSLRANQWYFKLQEYIRVHYMLLRIKPPLLQKVHWQVCVRLPQMISLSV